MQNKKLSIILTKMLEIYVRWVVETKNLKKIHRYSLGIKVEKIFDDIIELISEAQFAENERQFILINQSSTKIDVLKFMFYVLLELKEIDYKKCEDFTLQLEEIGRMLYGWKNRIISKMKDKN